MLSTFVIKENVKFQLDVIFHSKFLNAYFLSLNMQEAHGSGLRSPELEGFKSLKGKCNISLLTLLYAM